LAGCLKRVRMRVDRVTTSYLFFSLIGLVAASLGYLDFRSGGSLCPASLDVLSCPRVYAIPQARILGVHLSEVALVYFLVLATIALLSLAYKGRGLLSAYLMLSLAGLSVIPYLVYLELVVAKALCLYCTIMHIAIVGCAVTSALLWTRF